MMRLIGGVVVIAVMALGSSACSYVGPSAEAKHWERYKEYAPKFTDEEKRNMSLDEKLAIYNARKPPESSCFPPDAEARSSPDTRSSFSFCPVHFAGGTDSVVQAIGQPGPAPVVGGQVQPGKFAFDGLQRIDEPAVPYVVLGNGVRPVGQAAEHGSPVDTQEIPEFGTGQVNRLTLRDLRGFRHGHAPHEDHQ